MPVPHAPIYLQAPPYDPDAPDAADRLAEARAHIDPLPRQKPYMLPAFLAAQHVLGWLPREAVEHVAAHTRVPIAEVYATATAYSELRLERPDPRAWYICTGVSCELAGAGALFDAIPDQAQRIDCQFLCALAPVVVDAAERLHGRVTPEALAAKAADPATAFLGASSGGSHA